MPIFFQHSINDSTRLGIWKIEEQENFFLQHVPLRLKVSHPYKRLQHLAGRLLLPHLFEDFPLGEILIADTRKPFLEDEQYHFSISHCGNFAAAVASSDHRVGVDLELVTPRLKAIARKFLSPDEAAYLEKWRELSTLYLQMLTIIWCAKESIFKWHGLGNVDFSDDIQLAGVIEFRANEWIEVPFTFLKGGNRRLTVMGRTFDELVVTYVVTPQD